LAKPKEEYVKDYLESAAKLGIRLDLTEQAIIKTAEMAWAVDSYAVEPGDEPTGEPRKEGA
jgi:hypothetical protein